MKKKKKTFYYFSSNKTIEMAGWTSHVAQAMKGKKFANRQEANEFMKKLSAEWKTKKGEGRSDVHIAHNKGSGYVTEPPTATPPQGEPTPPPKKGGRAKKGSGAEDEIKSIMSSLSEEDKQELATIVEKFLKKKGRGKSSLSGLGTSSILLKPGLGAPGTHLSSLPK
jgi:hypothetical protein